MPAQTRVADAAVEKREAMIARAFDRERDLLPRPRLDVGERQGHRLLDQAVDFELPGARVDDRPIEMRDRKELVVGRDPGIEILPDELSLDDLRNRIRRQLIEPANDFLAGPARKGVGASGGKKAAKPASAALPFVMNSLRGMSCMTASPIPLRSLILPVQFTLIASKWTDFTGTFRLHSRSTPKSRRNLYRSKIVIRDSHAKSRDTARCCQSRQRLEDDRLERVQPPRTRAPGAARAGRGGCARAWLCRAGPEGADAELGQGQCHRRRAGRQFRHHPVLHARVQQRLPRRCRPDMRGAGRRTVPGLGPAERVGNQRRPGGWIHLRERRADRSDRAGPASAVAGGGDGRRRSRHHLDHHREPQGGERGDPALAGTRATAAS